MVEISWTVDPGAGGYNRLDGLPYDPFRSNAAGYGNMRRSICRAFDALGIAYRLVPAPTFLDRLRPCELQMPEGWEGRPHPGGTQWRRICRMTDVQKVPRPDPRSRPHVTRVCIGTPETWQWGGAGRRIGMTMWESTSLPDGQNSWVPWLEDADEVLVPCEQNADLVRQQAPSANVRSVSLAVDGNDWPLLDRTHRPGAPFTFLLSGQLSYRKGWMQAYQAFMLAFGRDRRFRLVMKTSSRSELAALMPQSYVDPQDRLHPVRSRWLFTWEDPNVTVLRSFYSPTAMLRLHQMADAFIWPSLGEGYGLPPREAALTGMPTISTDNTGLSDAGSWAWRVIPSTPDGVAAIFGPWGYCGQWHRLNPTQLAALMVQTYQERVQAAEWQRDVARPYLLRRSWKDVAQEILEPVEKREEALCA